MEMKENSDLPVEQQKQSYPSSEAPPLGSVACEGLSWEPSYSTKGRVAQQLRVETKKREKIRVWFLFVVKVVV